MVANCVGVGEGEDGDGGAKKAKKAKKVRKGVKGALAALGSSQLAKLLAGLEAGVDVAAEVRSHSPTALKVQYWIGSLTTVLKKRLSHYSLKYLSIQPYQNGSVITEYARSHRCGNCCLRVATWVGRLWRLRRK